MNNLKLKYVVELLDYETMKYKKLKKWGRKLCRMFDREQDELKKEWIWNEVCDVEKEVMRRKDKAEEMVAEVLIPDLAGIVREYL